MSGNTKITWADKTWNPVTGCTKISPGCANCYAERMSKRFGKKWGLPADNPFKVTNRDDKTFLQPLRWKKPSKIFVCSMGDLFHSDVNVRWIDGIFAIMGLTYDHTGKMVKHKDSDGESAIHKQRHTYLILTKRPERMAEYVNGLVNSTWEDLRKRFYTFSMAACDLKYQAAYMNHMNASMVVATWIKAGMPGLGLGVTAENQEQADKRIPILLQIPAEKRFVSVEPMLSHIKLRGYLMHGKDPGQCLCGHGHGFDRCPNYGGVAKECHVPGCECRELKRKNFAIHHVICGGESGPGARPMHPEWVRNLRDQCQAAGVPFLFKQWGSASITGSALPGNQWHDAGYCFKDKKGGRLLDGVLWDQYPEVNAK